MIDGIGVEPDGGLLIRAIAAYDGVVGDPKACGPGALRVLDEARRAGEVEALVVALRAVAWFARSRLEHTRARALLDEAVRRARRGGLGHRLVEVLITRAAVDLERGHVAGAARDLDRADRLGNGSAPPDVDFMQAVLLHNLGRLDGAARAYRRVLAHPGASADNRGSAANNAALIAAVQGRYDDSLRHLDTAAGIADEVGPSLHAFVAHNRGLVLAQSGRLAASLAQFDHATALFEREEIPLGEHYIEHADVLAELRLIPEALVLARRAVKELDAHGVHLMAAEARLTVAQVSLLAGDPGAASASAVAARAQFRRQRRSAWAARASVVEAQAGLLRGTWSDDLLARARRAAGVLDRRGMPAAASVAHLTAGLLAEELGRTAMAAQAFAAAADRSARGPVLVRLRGRLAAARAERLRGVDGLVLAHCRAGLADLSRHRAALGSMELRALASGHGVELGRLGLDLLVRSGSATRVLDWMEQTRAAALLVTGPPAPDTVRDELAELAAVNAELAQAVRETGGTPPELLTRQAAAEECVRRVTWRREGSAVSAGVAARPPEIRARLGSSALVSYGTLDGALFAVVVHGSRRARLVALGPTDAVRFEGDALLFALRRLTRPGSAPATAAARTSAEHAIERLAGLLVRPLGLPDDVSLVVVPEGATSRVPWSALHSGPVSVAPSASLWARTRDSQAATSGEVLLVAGPGLDGAVEEVHAVAALHRHRRVLTLPDATVGAVVDALGRAELAHLACHGMLRGDNPTFSALQLVDGPLTVHELDTRGIAPRRVVLAACDSAADVAYDGGELLGFVSALLARGTAGLVASVVAVGDVEAVALMCALHEGLAAGHTMSDALHVARSGIDRSDPRAFVNWCAFTAYGAG